MPATFLTANDLRTGEIVYWTHKEVWSLDPKQALLAADEAGLSTLTSVLENAQIELEVVGPYLVTAQEGAAISLEPSVPKKLRERRRLAGPGASLLPLPKAA